MTIIPTTYYCVECEACDARTEVRSSTINGAAMWAASHGWQVAVDGDDLCPECVEIDVVHTRTGGIDLVAVVEESIHAAMAARGVRS